MKKIIIVVFISCIVLIVVYFLCYFLKTAKNNRINSKTNKNVSYQLKIKKINIDAPIVLNMDGKDEETYNKALESGVAHMLGTALPGEEGNIVIFGHSSKPKKYIGNYGAVFANINDLSIGDILEINSTNRETFKYKIEQKLLVDGKDVSYIQPTTDDRLTISTCWPIGSDKSRMILVTKKY